MSKRTKTNRRATVTAVRVPLSALVTGGSVSIGFAKTTPNLLSAQTSSTAAHEARTPRMAQTVTHYKSPSCTCRLKWGDDLVTRLLEEKPGVTGIAVPGMPLGSPGMEGFGGKHPYDVTAFGRRAEYVFEPR